MNMRKIAIITAVVILSFVSAFASILIESGSYGEIFPAENGDMHILIRNNNSSYMYYSSGGIAKEVPLGVGDSSIIFETAASDGEGGVYVLYDDLANKTLYAQRYNSSGVALWDAPGSIVDTYNDRIVFTISNLTPDGNFIVIYDNFTPAPFPPYGVYDGYLRVISPDGVVSNPVGTGKYYHDQNVELHGNLNTLYIKRWANSYITPVFGDTTIVGDSLNSGILEFDCDDNGYIFGLRLTGGSYDILELYRFDDKLHALWETPIECYVGFNKRSSEPIYVRPEIMANSDGSVTIYPSRYSYSNQNISRVDSLGEYVFSNLEIDVVLDAISIKDGSNLFLENHRQNDSTRVVQLVKVSVNGDIHFSSILRYGNIWEGSIIENTDGSFATILMLDDSIAVDKISRTGEILVGVKDITTPADFTLSQNYPNPFNPTTRLQYGLPEVTDVNLMIFDITGRKIKEWSISNQQAGWHEVIWDGTDQSGSLVSTGVYIYCLQAGNFVDTKKMVFMK